MGGLIEANLRALAGARSFERGLGYLDAVSGVEVGDAWVSATVHGTERYEVGLTLDGPGGLVGECDCPYGQEGNFCKHLVALGLTVLGRRESLPRQRKADLAAVDTALVDYLSDRYAQADRLPDAVVLRRDHFAARRTLLTYRQLRAAARAADCWPAERKNALALLRADAGRKGVHGAPALVDGAPVLVDVLLDDEGVDADWQAATETGAHDGQWLTRTRHLTMRKAGRLGDTV